MNTDQPLTSSRWRVRQRVVSVALGALVAALAAGCTDRTSTEGLSPLPVMPTAYPTGPASSGPGVAQVSEDIQALSINVSEQGFETDIYSVQNRPMRVEVSSSGGPYTLAIDGVLQPQPLDADGTTVISLSPPRPGDFTMRLSGAQEDTATLNVRAPGER
jgi:hypothetical protein